MLKRTREWIKQQVSIRIDEFSVNATSTGGGTVQEDPISAIDDELDYSTLEVLRNARIDLLFALLVGNKKFYQGDYVNDVDIRTVINDTGDLSVLIIVPQDYVRLGSMRMNSWSRSVRKLIMPNDERYESIKGNIYGASPRKPAAALVPYTQYELKLTGTITGTFQVGETVTGSGGQSGNTACAGKVKEIGSGFIVLEEVIGGSFDLNSRGNTTGTGGDSGATINTLTAISDETKKYKIIKRVTTNITYTNVYDGQAIDGLTLATGDIISLEGQSTSSENGIIRVGADHASITILATEASEVPNTNLAIEAYRADDGTDVLDEFMYVPFLKPEEVEGEVLDMVIYVCAARVLRYLGRNEEAMAAMNEAARLMKVQLQGFEFEQQGS